MHARALWLVIGAIAALPSRGAAQSAGDQAQRLFDDGRRLLDGGKIAEACTAFDASQKLDPLVATELNVAACREQNGQLATAWNAFVEAGRMARAGGDDKLEKVAAGHAQKLEPRLSRLTISVPPDRRIPGLEVLRGNEPVGTASWDRALPVDGGSYTIVARAPGHESWSTTRTIKAERDAQTVVIPRLAEIHAPAPAPVAPAPSPPALSPPAPAVAGPGDAPATPVDGPPATEPTVDQPTGPSYVVPIALGAAALALGGTGLGFELRSETIYHNAETTNASMNPNAHAIASSLRDSAVRDRYIAQGVAAAAIGCAGVGVYLFVRNRGERRPAAAVMPVASSGLAGVALTGRW
jgi:hypothetical protein